MIVPGRSDSRCPTASGPLATAAACRCAVQRQWAPGNT